MNFKWISFRIRAKRSLVNFWYLLMKPLATYFSDEKERARYQKKKDRITHEQAVQWVAEDIAKYLVKDKAHYKSGGTVNFIIAESAHREDTSGSENMASYNFYFVKRKKAKIALYKFKKNVDFQDAVIQKIGTFNGFTVTEKRQNFTWERLLNYQTSYIVTYEG